MLDDQDRVNLHRYREFVQLVGHRPPRIQCPGGSLSPEAYERLAERPDLVAWALGQPIEEETC